MIFHQYPFHLDNVNYRLVVASKLVVECWLAPIWRQVPNNMLGLLLHNIVARDVEIGSGFFHTITSRHHGMRMEVNYPRSRRWLRRKPVCYLQQLDLTETDPWVDVDPEEPLTDLPIIVGENAIIYRISQPAGLWGLWAALNHQGYLSLPWQEPPGVASTSPPEEDN